MASIDDKWKLSKSRSASKSSSYASAGFPPSSLTKSASSSASSSSTARHRRCSFTRKCARLVREQRARFYIMRRCVTMLICWRDYADS